MWKNSLELLQRKFGSASTLREFRRLIGNTVEMDQEFGHMPDYAVRLDDDDIVVFTNRGTMEIEQSDENISILLRPETLEEAKAIAPGWDIYLLEQEWRTWMSEPPRFPDAAFLGFCRKWYEKRGMPA